MALIVQTKPPTDGANAYVDVAGFKAYHDARLQSYTAFTDAQIEAACIAGTEYLDMRFNYNGWRTYSEQTTEFPRNDLYNSRGDLVLGIPPQVVKATCEYAIRWLRQGMTLIPDPTVDDSGRPVKSTETEVGPVKTKVEFADSATYQLPQYPLPDGMLRSQGFISSGVVAGIASRATGRS